jgi:hypothetical protein
MSLVLRLLAAFGFGLYSCLGLHVYSTLVSRTKGDGLRLLLFILCIPLVFGLPIFAWVRLLSGVGVSWSRFQRKVLVLAWLLLWIGTVWVYMVMNWRVLNQRLRVRKDTDEPSDC